MPEIAGNIYLLFDDCSASVSSQSFSLGLYAGLLRRPRRTFDKARSLAGFEWRLGSLMGLLWAQLSTGRSRTDMLRAKKERLIRSAFGISYMSPFQGNIIKQ